MVNTNFTCATLLFQPRIDQLSLVLLSHVTIQLFTAPFPSKVGCIAINYYEEREDCTVSRGSE
jgi:hypothetical protein